MRMVKIDIFQAKNHQKFIFWVSKELYTSKEAENTWNKDSARKTKNHSKKNLKNSIFFNFLDMLEDPQKIQFSIFQKFWKIYFKNGFTGTSQIVRETKSPILVILALLMRKLQTNVWCPGHIDPCPPEIGLKISKGLRRSYTLDRPMNNPSTL